MIVLANPAKLEILDLKRVFFNTCTVHLYINPIWPTGTTTVGGGSFQLHEATFTGYAPQGLSFPSGAFLVGSIGLVVGPPLNWTCTGTGGGDRVYGYYVTDGSGNLIYSERCSDVGVPMNVAGQGVTLAPTFRESDVSTLPPVGPVAWWRGDAGTWQNTAGTIPAISGGDPVQRWDDQTVYGNDLLTVPTYGIPTLDTGAPHGLICPSFVWNIDRLASLTALSLVLNDNFTLAFAMHFGTSGLFSGFPMAQHNSPDELLLENNAGAIYCTVLPSGVEIFSAPLATTGWHTVVCCKNGTDRRMYVDGVDLTTIYGNAAHMGGGGITIEGDGGVGEALVYNRALSPAEVGTLAGWLSRWL